MMLSTYYDGVSIFRGDRVIYGRFLKPHMVVSTCRAAGGVQRGMEYVLNHQSCEPKSHSRNLNYRDSIGYRKSVCEEVDLPPDLCVTMGTAANMYHGAIIHESFRDLEVIAVITGGVETNAGRAGDPASVLELENGFESLRPQDDEKKKEGEEQEQEKTEIKPGTINTMVFISKPLTIAALTRVIMTATEAKSAALQELAINSRYSDGLATGTGTDQIIVSAPEPRGGEYSLTWSGKHSKLGELIGQAVKKGVKETLARQNGITPTGQCSVKIHLERFGCTRETMIEGICQYLSDDSAALLQNNFHAINKDPIVVAGVVTLAHLKDTLSWGILPATCSREILGTAAAQLACSVGGRYDRMANYREELAAILVESDISSDLFLSLCWQALAIGFRDKWPD